MSFYSSNSRPSTSRNSSSRRSFNTNRYQREFHSAADGSTTSPGTSIHGGGVGGRGIQQDEGQVITPQTVEERAFSLTVHCQECLKKAEWIISNGGLSMEAEKFLALAAESLDKLKMCGMRLQEMRIPNEVFKNIMTLQQWHANMLQNLMEVGFNSGVQQLVNSAMAWIAQQKRIIETAPWGDDSSTIDNQITAHNKFHSSIQRSPEVDRAKYELMSVNNKNELFLLDQEWLSLQKMSHSRSNQLRELQNIIDDIFQAIMWVNEREEEELVFDWGDKNIDQYIPKKQESYSRLMRDLEEKEKDLNKLKLKAGALLSSSHPASDKIEAYMDTLQTQWSWLLQITKCIHVHLKENAAYSQFFKEANEIYAELQKQHEAIRTKFVCDKSTPMENLTELLKNLETEKQQLMENKRQVQSLVNKSKSIVRLKPRNPEEKTSSPIMVQAICDFKQDQKGILKGNEGILKDNSQRSKWLVTGPGGLDMSIPSVCLLIPPPNPLSIGLANKNEQYYEAILGIWNELYINIKCLISWQYCLKELNNINSLNISKLSNMRPDEYRSIIKRLETHYQEFLHTSQGSDMFVEEERKSMQDQIDKAQQHYDTLVIQLPTYTSSKQRLHLWFSFSASNHSAAHSHLLSKSSFHNSPRSSLCDSST